MSTLSEQRFADMASAAGEFLWETDPVGRYVYVSERIRDVLGFEPAEVIGRHFGTVISPSHVAAFSERILKPMHRGESFVEAECVALRKCGASRWLRLRAVPYRSESGAFGGYRGAGMDVSERKEAEERLVRLANHDSLTGLPNRRLLHDRLGDALVASQRERQHIAALFVDLDGFKTINDCLGHEAGDQVLVDIAARLKACAGESDTIARLGGDEFVVVSPVGSRLDAAALAERLLRELRRPLLSGRRELRISASIGVAMSPDDGTEPASLMRAADAAMYKAKDEGRHGYCFFTPALGDAAVRRLGLESALARALERSEFVFHYQPKLDLESGRVAGVEALVRWRHPIRGLVPPAEFIEVADEIGLTPAMTGWAFEAACSQLARWDRAGAAVPSVAINLTARQFGDELLVDTIEAALARHALAPSRLQIEITETAMLQFEGRTASNLERLARVGVMLSLDDFGTGYSNLAYLKRLPIRQLKVDRTFVNDLGGARDSRPLVAAIVTMAHSLGMRVVAEGVETRDQLATVQALGCDEAQGYLISTPLAASRIARWIVNESGRAPAGAPACGTPADRRDRPAP